MVGKEIQFLLLGDATVGQEALLRFYVLHVAVLPVVLTLLIAIHFWRIRKDGGLSRRRGGSRAGAGIVKPIVPQRGRHDGRAAAAKNKVYGLQGFVRGPFTKVGNVPDNSVYAWPNLLHRRAVRLRADACR